ncbi:beta-lactamase family protein [Amycolatopsis rhizosphaerae]|uniref:Beta-lactamase family protein n=1 Tax=Amycolatopsis rhizosphaerae TaxID=2053003 RepID=A0A558DDE5_9PSEU|nr:serine hydrolase domain-containing protein [Amycolatopsis rhizosphaerae]TVT59049.1 beta-lactamase family protein [Amycolatopsis rhizosphaerae]
MNPSRRSVLAMLGATGAVLTLPAKAQAVPARIPSGLRPEGEFDRFVKEQADQDAFSGSLLVINRGRTVLARSYGMADKAKSVPNGPDTLFALASVTKLFTAVAVAQLAQDGKVAYHGKLGTYLTGFPDDIAGKVTVHHLLTHTSGFGDLFTMPGYLEAAATWTSAQQAMDSTTDFVRTSTLSFAPGAGWQYSNAGYHLLGAIVQQVSGQSYYDYVRTNIFGKAGMTSSDFYTKPQWRADPRMAHPYGLQPSGGRTDGLEDRMFVGGPAGDAFSNCPDMARFAEALLGHELLNPEYTQITIGGKVPPSPNGPGRPPTGTMRRQAVFQAYGPQAVLINGQWNIGHSGGSFGEATDFQLYPDSRYVTVILSNYDYDRNLGMPPVFVKAQELIVSGGA